MSTAAASRPSGHVLSSPTHRSASPTRVKLSAGGATGSPVKSVSVSSPPSSPTAAPKIRRSCMCSPTNHPGSFRCSLHKERKQEAPAVSSRPASPPSPPSNSKRTASPLAQLLPSGSGCSKRPDSGLAQRVPMGSGHWARKALAPSPAVQQLQHRKRAGGYRAGASRLSAPSMAGRSNQ